MISVAEAKQRLLQNIPAPLIAELPIAEAAGYVLAEAIYSPLDMPAFPQSAMDGYAFAYASVQEGVPLLVSHVIQAGSSQLPVVKPGEAVRIFTGAPVPAGADTVVMQEKVAVEGNKIVVLDADLKRGANVRPKASQTAKGELAASAGTRLSAGALGFLASLGLANVKVYAAPKVGILLTGKELVKPGEPLQMGKVYESNSVTLRAALSGAGISPQLVRHVDDEEALIAAAVEEGLSSCNLLLITGGISVGDYDFVHKALQQADVTPIFYKVKQRPGKPIYCGRRGDTLVFGLPGNPASVLSCFYQYVVPAVRQMKGLSWGTENQVMKSLSADFTKKAGLTFFMKAKMEKEQVTILQAQESYKMNAFVESNCMVELAEEAQELQQGTQVRVYPFNQLWA